MLKLKTNRQGKFTSESVGKGHPDKICDQIADAVLDHILEQSPNSRVACEVLASNRLILIGGEITTNKYVDVVKSAWEVVKPLGYTENDFTIISNINAQSIEIAKLVNQKNGKLGAGDQGITIGYATNESKSFMPLGTLLANDLLIEVNKFQLNNDWIKHDMKSQITLEYSDDKVDIKQVILAIQHDSKVKLDYLRDKIIKCVIAPVLWKYKFINKLNDIDKSICLINQSGTFIVGGPIGDTGLTGRKLMVDTYGSYAHHGGGAFSGKDYTKVDRTGSYYARWIAKHIVALNWASECEVKLSWAIGKSKPIDLSIDCFNTNTKPMNEINKKIAQFFNYSLSEIVDLFAMKKIKYLPYSVYGHFGRDESPWESLSLIKKLV
ncbi:methionine adenosyltransferase [Mycoplasmoides alvi]|uniref:methionine adenosyltransferase n=1 Tax=Mycoplasmoides alvi TaxID=78580 RepID=UPI00051BDC3D|nr:methionine adenosyltransferase [Mycoplasmoides alvi]